MELIYLIYFLTSLLMIGMIVRDKIVQSTLKSDEITVLRMPGIAIPSNQPISSPQFSTIAKFSASAQFSAF